MKTDKLPIQEKNDQISLPRFVFVQMGKRSALARKKKLGDNYKNFMSEMGKKGGRPLKQAKENVILTIDKASS